jgi:peptidoglycan/LPS O-acetylase OafA/YrhL
MPVSVASESGSLFGKSRSPDLLADGAPKSARLVQLDALRAFAILAVLFEHWSGLRDWVPIGAGTLGVGLFFTLSGFLITGILLEDLEQHRPSARGVLMAFYIRRFARLAPAFYLVLLVLALLGIGGISSSWPWHVAYLSNFYMAMGGTESVFWTLAVEEQFYLLWPVVLVLTPRRWSLRTTMAMFAIPLLFKLSALTLGYVPRFYLLPWQIDVLGGGCLLAILSFRNGKANQFDWVTARRTVIFTVVAAACLSLAALDWYVNRGGLTRLLFVNPLCGVFYAWATLMAARGWKGWVGRVLDNPALRYIGRISYGIYLVHNSIPDFVEKVFGPLPKYQAAPIVVVLTFSVCAFSWRFVEKPLMRLGRQLSDAVGSKNSIGHEGLATSGPLDASKSIPSERVCG